KGTTVSLWTFGQVPTGVAMVRDPKGGLAPANNDPIALAAEREPERTIKQQIPPTPWGGEQLDVWSRHLDGLQPYFGTPLLQAMGRAANEDLRDAKGIRTLLVLTDGADNRFATNRVFNPRNQKIADFIGENFKPMGIRIHMVFFTPAVKPEELERA